MLASWWISTLAFTCVIVIVLSIPTFFHITAFTLTSCAIEVLIVWAGLVLWAFAATALGVEILTSMAIVWLADTFTCI